MASPFSVDKKYENYKGYPCTFLGVHPYISDFKYMFTEKNRGHVLFVDEKGRRLDEASGLATWPVFVCEVKPKIARWVNVYKNELTKQLWSGDLFESREEAETGGGTNSRVACVKVEFEEGEGL